MLRSGRLLFSLILLTGVLRAFSALAQAPTVVTANGANAVPIPGAGHNYIHLLSETVDPSSGNVSVTIPFPTRPGRGITFPLTAYLSQPPFQVTTNLVSSEIELEDHPYPGQAEVTWTENTFQAGVAGGQSGTSYVTCDLATAFTFTGLDNVSHNLALYASEFSASSSVPAGVSEGSAMTACGSGTAAGAGVNEGGDQLEVNAYFSTPSKTQSDIAAWTLDTGSKITPVNGPVGPFTVTDQAGTTYFFDGNGALDTSRNLWSDQASLIEDRNGNELSECSAGVYCDTSGQQVGAGVATSITTEGTATASYTVPTFLEHSSQTAQGTTYTVLCNPTSNWTVPSPSAGYTPAPIPGEITVGFGTPASGEGSLVYYHLYYGNYGPGPSNNYGLINEIIYPDGGWVKYTYPTALPSAQDQMTQAYEFGGTLNSGTTPVGYGCYYLYSTPQVATRMVSYDGTHVAQTQAFSYSANFPGSIDNASDWISKSTSILTEDNVVGSSYLTIYTYAAIAGGIQPHESLGGSSTQVPVERTVVHYSGASTTTSILETETKGWYDQFHVACDLKTLPNGTTGHFYTYDSTFLQVNDDKEYDYGAIETPDAVCSNALSATGTLTWLPPSKPTRETVTTYQAFTNILGTSFGKPSTVLTCYGASTCNSSTRIAETDYSYDQNAVVSASPTSHDSQFTSGSGTPTTPLWSRGNVTTATKLCLQGCNSNSVTQYTYDLAGQVRESIDPCGNATCGDMPGQANHTTLYAYDPTYDTYVTGITRPTTSNGVAHTETYQYNYTTGQVQQEHDENQQTTQFGYDPILRLQDIYAPGSVQNGGAEPHTHYVYEDSETGGTITKTDPIGGTTVTITDGMGHPLKTKVFYPSGTVQETDTTYDGMGHTHSVSNPYISASDLSYGTTVYAYDGLGRVIQQCQPDNVSSNQGVNNSSLCSPQYSFLTWNYGNGNQVIFTDENGNQWARTTDGLGRLKQVLEPNASDATTIETDYQYDGLDNLLQVDQWGGASGSTGDRQRKFAYDSLSRLVMASNPETGTTCYGTLSGSTCINGYDANGNLSTKQDARGVVTSFSYDALNRLVSKSSSGALSSCFSYDGSIANGIGRLYSEWTQSGACSSGSSSLVTNRSIQSYDEMGRITQEQQAGPSLWYGYDLDGN